MAGWKTHAYANCTECWWDDGDQEKALSRGRAHNRKTGHVVIAETAHAFQYDEIKLDVPKQGETE